MRDKVIAREALDARRTGLHVSSSPKGIQPLTSSRSMTMQIDFYTKVVLSLIAFSLIVLALREVFAVRVASAQGPVTCSGELMPTPIGGYKLRVECN
jgi:hypothetical protein